MLPSPSLLFGLPTISASAHARRQDQTREGFLAMQGRGHLSFKALLFPHELVAFLRIYSAFSKNWQPASICDRINKRVCEMQNSSHQNDFGGNTFFAKDVMDDVQNDSWNPTSKWQCDDQKYRFWEFNVSFHASPLITVKYLGWAFQMGAYNDVRKTSGKNG